MSPAVVIALSLFCASLVMGLTGFGFAITAISLLSFVLPVREVVPFIFTYNICINLVLLIQLRAHVRFHRTRPQLIGFLPGAVIGLLGLAHLPDPVLKIIVGAALTGFASWMGIYRPCGGLPARPGWAGFAGFLAGLLGGAVYMPGPPVIVYNALTQPDRFAFKVDLQVFFLMTNACLFIAYLYINLFSRAVVVQTVMYAPFMVAGLVCGLAVFRRLPQEAYQRLVEVLIGVMGVVLTVKTILHDYS